MLKLVKQHHLLVVAVFQLVQRLANRINLTLAQHFTNQLQLAAATFHFDPLGQLNGGAQVRIKRDFIQRVFPQIHQFRAQAFELLGVAFNFTFTDPDNFIVFVFDALKNGSLLDFRETLYIMAFAMKVISQVEAQRKILEEAVSTALELASGKSDGAEVAVSKTTGISVSTRYGEVENVEFNSDGALGITVYHQNRKGSASSTDLSPQAIARTVQAALDIARYTSPDPCAGVADKELLAFDAPDLDLFHPAEVSPDEAIELAARAEQASLQADKRITNTEGGSFNSHYGIKVFGNSHGMLQGYCSTRHSLSSCVIAEENGDMERDYAYTIGRAMGDLQTPEWVGADCARRTLSRLSPRKLSTMKAPVIFANEVATGLFGHLVGAIAGGSVYRKSTFLLDSLGKQILPEWLTIEEHPHLLKGLASSPFDSEGVRTERRDIVKDGVLTQWLLTNYSARKLGLKSTGHAGGIHNWRIAGQGLSFEQMLKEMGTGLVVTELMGQGVSGITGDYSRGAAGFWVENGEIQYPVSEITIAGNLKEMWRNIVTVGNDIETRSNIQCGSVLLPEMKIAGQ